MHASLTVSYLLIPSTFSFFLMLKGLQRQFGAFQILKSVESFFQAIGAFCKSDFSSFCINVSSLTFGAVLFMFVFVRNIIYLFLILNIMTFSQIMLSNEDSGIILKDASDNVGGSVASLTSNGSNNLHCPLNELSFRVSVCLLVLPW